MYLEWPGRPPFVARRGIEPQTIHLKGEHFNHCATDLAFFPDQSPENISKTQKYSGFVIQNVRSQKVTAGFL